MKIYCTSYCNSGHDLETGKPIDHECRVIPPKALMLERQGKYEEAIEVMDDRKRGGMGDKEGRDEMSKSMTKNGILRRAGFLGISCETSAPGDGCRRYEFFSPGSKPYVYGRQLGFCLGAREAEIFLRGFDEGKIIGEEKRVDDQECKSGFGAWCECPWCGLRRKNDK